MTDTPHNADDHDAYVEDGDDYCPNCGGEGVIYDCIDGFCVNAEDGCDLCERRCDWCRSPKSKSDPVNLQGSGPAPIEPREG